MLSSRLVSGPGRPACSVFTVLTGKDRDGAIPALLLPLALPFSAVFSIFETTVYLSYQLTVLNLILHPPVMFIKNLIVAEIVSC